jgi:hypothetical protein
MEITGKKPIRLRCRMTSYQEVREDVLPPRQWSTTTGTQHLCSVTTSLALHVSAAGASIVPPRVGGQKKGIWGEVVHLDMEGADEASKFVPVRKVGRQLCVHRRAYD